MIVAAHQPAYLPWLGYLHKLAACDVFVVLDDVQYEDRNFQNRNRVKTGQGAAWLTVPLQRGPQDERICDKKIHNEEGSQSWQRRTWRTLTLHYGRSPHFDRYAAELEEVFTRRWDWLLDLDMHLLQLSMAWLSISKPVVRSSTLALQSTRTGRIVEACGRLGADTYLAGRGGSASYLDVDQLAAAGVRVSWQQFKHPEYPQRYMDQGFVPNLAFIDLLLNCGPDSGSMLLGDGMRTTPRAAVVGGDGR